MNRKTLTVALLVVGGATLAACGSSPDEPTEAKTIQAEAVEVAPSECLAALDDADAMAGIISEDSGLSGEVFNLAAQAIEAALYGDYATLESLNIQMESINTEKDTLLSELGTVVDSYIANRDACRSAANAL